MEDMKSNYLKIQIVHQQKDEPLSSLAIVTLAHVKST